MDDFDIAVVDQPSRKRVKYTRQCLKDTGAEVKCPFGDEKWAEGEPSQDMVSLGIGFDVTNPLNPTVYIPKVSVKEVVYLMRQYVKQDTLLLSEAQSLASKLLRMTMVVENGRLYVCGLFALSRLVSAHQAKLRRLTLRHQKKRKRGASSDEGLSVLVTHWARRNMHCGG
jgi:hypothetical protein